MSVHERFDLERWVSEFSLARARSEARAFVLDRAKSLPDEYREQSDVQRHVELMSPRGDAICSPETAAYLEQLRAESDAGLRDGVGSLGPAVATDVLVWGLGEPPNPGASKIGGVPFRPKGKSWPVTRGGEPATFVGQLCFSDSMDILCGAASDHAPSIRLPGEVLLIFAANRAETWDGDETGPDPLAFEWYDLDLPNRMSADELPPDSSPFGPYFAQLHRTFDYPRVPEGHPLLRHGCSYLLDITEGTKIGGVPGWIQGEEPRPGAFFAALTGVALGGERWPALNHPSPIAWTKVHGFELGDSGCVYLYLDSENPGSEPVVRWTMQCY